MNIGVIGLGTMGGEMVRPLIAAGHRVVVHDLAADAVTRAVENGAEPAPAAAAIGAEVAVVLLSLPMAHHVEAVVTGPDGLLTRPSPGLVIVDTSTVDPDTTRRLAARAASVDVRYLDAPILGRPVSCGGWTVPVGGDPATLETARPALQPLARRIVHAGPAGAGNALKLLNQLMFGAINTITAEVFAAAPLVGVAPEAFYEAVAGSEAATVSPLFRVIGKKMLEQDFSPIFTVDLLRKDIALGLGMMKEAGSLLGVASAVNASNNRAHDAGLGDEDTSAMLKLYQALLTPTPPNLA